MYGQHNLSYLTPGVSLACSIGEHKNLSQTPQHGHVALQKQSRSISTPSVLSNQNNCALMSAACLLDMGVKTPEEAIDLSKVQNVEKKEKRKLLNYFYHRTHQVYSTSSLKESCMWSTKWLLENRILFQVH
jgi:hypothetical protein